MERKLLKEGPPSSKSNQDGRDRFLLACGVLVLTALALVLYAITRDTVLLLASGIVGTSIYTVLHHYFRP